MKLVFATHNQNKFREVKALIPTHIELLSLVDIGCHDDIEESASTIEGNAFLKADYVKTKYGYNCFADDTGLEVQALNNEPGVYSARYAGPENNAQKNMRKLLQKLEGEHNRTARFKTAIALCIGDNEKMFLGICKGDIIKIQRGNAGFGYDPIFRPNGADKTFSEMTMEEKSEIGHRGKAIKKLLSYLME